MRPLFLSWILAACATCAESPLILQIRVVEGEGAVYPAGSRAIKGITVEVTDEAGQPVPSTAVSFRLPEDGPTGTFQNGTRTEIATTAASGRATVWGMKWNRLTGAMIVRVTAAKGETRAGAVVQQNLVEPSSPAALAASGKQDMVGYKVHRNRRWIWVSAIAAAAAGGGLAFGARAGQGSTNAAAPAVNVTIGSPSIVVGR